MSNEECAKVNEKLREKYGQKITVRIKTYLGDDGRPVFYYTSKRYEDSDGYPSVEEAYKNADIYLNGVGDLW